jgi:hypothetical protein
VATIRRFLPLLGCALTLIPGPGCTRAYLQNEGFYEMTAVEVLRDDCAMLSAPEDLWDGTLHIAGKVARMDYELLGMQLIGGFLDGGTEDDDAFSLDGSVTHASLVANGQQCTVNQVTVHLEGTTRCATQFDGVVRVRFEPRAQQLACACELWARYTAIQASAPCAGGL